MDEASTQDESRWDRLARSPAFLYLVPPTICMGVAAIAAWLTPSVTYIKAPVTRYELRYVEGVGNVEYPAGSEIALVRHFELPTRPAAMRRLPPFLVGGAAVGLLVGAILHLRSKRLYKNGRRQFFKDGDLLPISGEPIQGELLPPIRGIGMSSERAPHDAHRGTLAK